MLLGFIFKAGRDPVPNFVVASPGSIQRHKVSGCWLMGFQTAVYSVTPNRKRQLWLSMVYKLFYEHVAKSGNVILFWLDEYSKGALKMHQTAHIRLGVNKTSARH